jgi:protein NRD1
MFSQYGKVQTSIVNVDKRHGFIKLYNRQDAERALAGMEKNPPDGNLRTRWGVGFGPRDCSDYSTGISIIPIDRLTDADKKWMLNAEYGGSGNKPILPGMVVEEPDIEIGAGVSSKAISRRMATDQSGHNGPHSSRGSRPGPGFTRGGRGKENFHKKNKHERFSNRITEENVNSIGVPPPVPNFGFSGMPPLPNGVPAFPSQY